MPVRTTIDIPEPLHDRLRQEAHDSGSSIRSLVIRALEQTFVQPAKRKRLSGPLVIHSGKLGPAFPGDENPHDLVFP